MDEPRLDATDRQRIASAIRDAEAATSGEIYCVLARSSGSYLFPAIAVFGAFMLALSLASALVLEWLWIGMRLPVFAALQILAAGCAFAVLSAFPRLQVRLVPRRLQYRQAHGHAVRQFLAHNVHVTQARTGVLIFVSIAERYAEVVADAGINQRVDQKQWDDIVAGLVEHARKARLGDGFVTAVGQAGALLAEHFPPQPGDVNELDDHLIEI